MGAENKESYWSKAVIEREAVFSEGASFDSLLSQDHPVRIYEILLSQVDWSDWEAVYQRRQGRPPIHPILLAGALLYGLSENVRSSRELENACRNRIDFIWLLEGRKIDHSTFAGFRQRFNSQIKDLLKQVNLIAGNMLKKGGKSLSIDGTKIRSNSSRHGAKTAEALNKKLLQLEANMEKVLQEMATQDAIDNPDNADINELQAAYEKLTGEYEKIEQVLKTARERDIVKQKKRGKNTTAARVPVTDPDSFISLNKEGGFAPNYTPVAAVDNETGTIIDCCVPNGEEEAAAVPGIIDESRHTFGFAPDEIAFDGAFPTGENLKYMSAAGIQALAPTFIPEDNPAIRADLTKPVPSEQLKNLPMNGKKLDRAAFVYDPADDVYWCPMGKIMKLENTYLRNDKNKKVEVKHYRCDDCSNCPLSEKCLSKNAKRRMTTRDEYEPLREKLHEYMKTDEAKKAYKKRAPNVEGCFANIKANMKIRQFLLRGIDKVRIEWTWICTAYSFRKLVNKLAG